MLLDTLAALQSAGPNDPNVERSPTSLTVRTTTVPAPYVTFFGTGFTFDAAGRHGHVRLGVALQGFLPIVRNHGRLRHPRHPGAADDAAVRNAGATLLPELLSGDDTFQVTAPIAETLSGYGGDDVFYVGPVALGGQPAVSRRWTAGRGSTPW